MAFSIAYVACYTFACFLSKSARNIYESASSYSPNILSFSIFSHSDDSAGSYIDWDLYSSYNFSRHYIASTKYSYAYSKSSIPWYVRAKSL